MKTKILFLCFVFLSGLVSAQTYYTLLKSGTSDEPTYKFTYLGSLVIDGKKTPFGDTLTKWQKLPFNWNFYGKLVKGYYISDNGYIIFDSNYKGNNPNNVSLPDTNAPKNAIFGFWDDLVTCDRDTAGDTKDEKSYTNLIHVWTYGSAPNRVHVIHWFRSYKGPYNADNASQFCFGIRLFESGLKAFDIVYDYRYLPNGGSVVATDATAGCQNYNGTNATMINGSPSFVFPEVTGDKADDVVYEFYYGNQSVLDLSMLKLDIADITKTNTDIPVKGTIRNMGSDVISYFTLNYRVDGGTTISQLVNSANIDPGKTYNFNHPDVWTAPSIEMNNIIDVWTSGLNGNPDQNNSNDTMKTVVQVLSNSAIRMPLHEVFTSSTCNPCKAGNINLRSILDNNPDKFTCIKYQESWPPPGDPYYTTECYERATYYKGISSVPNLFVDGGWNNNPSSYTQAIFDQYSEVYSFINLDANYSVLPYVYNTTDTTIKINVTVTPIANFIGYKPKLYLAIVEKLTTRNVKSNGETEFFYVMKKLVPTPDGTDMAKLERNKAQTFTKSYTFKGKYFLPADASDQVISTGQILTSKNSVEDYNNLMVVAWVQDDISRKVLQSTWGKLLTSIQEEYPNSIITAFYPNPVREEATLKFRLDKQENVSFEVVNTLGQSTKVLDQKRYEQGDHSVTLALSGLETGAYFLLIKTNSGVSSVKFIK
jgi:hypothetical protein